jgi:hypothetical protein
MFHNCNSQDGQLSPKLRRPIALSASVELKRSLLEKNEAKDKTVKSLEGKDLERQLEVEFWKKQSCEHNWEPNAWDNDGSSNADCRDREYATDRLGIS